MDALAQLRTAVKALQAAKGELRKDADTPGPLPRGMRLDLAWEAEEIASQVIDLQRKILTYWRT